MVRIRYIVERITYQNPENRYSVLKCRVKDYSDLVLVVGNLLDANVGSVLLAVGDIDQLPSVGVGNVLRDIIDSGSFPVNNDEIYDFTRLSLALLQYTGQCLR